MAETFPNGTDTDFSLDALRFTLAATWTLVNVPLWATTLTFMPEVACLVAFETVAGDGGAVNALDQYVSMLANSSLEIALSRAQLNTSVTAVFVAANPGVGTIGMLAERGRR